MPAATAKRLTAWAGSRAPVGRLGADEFAVTLLTGPAAGSCTWRGWSGCRRASAVDAGPPVDIAASVGAIPASCTHCSTARSRLTCRGSPER
ncbi:hypothetical protein OH805_00575 [Streptomyces sp. NBC_00879]|uniref:hypothetical protein n=1 Tax=Streptomyces sp. NBC_00879 TaxID=2975855 RepID=UPI00386F8107|nr:hypothetical protein OH805_00575 [Streptomyces sp. NBC_00879]